MCIHVVVLIPVLRRRVQIPRTLSKRQACRWPRATANLRCPNSLSCPGAFPRPGPVRRSGRRRRIRGGVWETCQIQRIRILISPGSLKLCILLSFHERIVDGDLTGEFESERKRHEEMVREGSCRVRIKSVVASTPSSSVGGGGERPG